MDIQSTIIRVKKEYSEYLRHINSEWSDSTVSTHVSDAL